MTDIDTHISPTLTASSEADLDEYGAISPLAVGALLLGIASVLALSGLILLVVPIVAVIAALLAVQRIARSEGALVGRTAAVVGLALACFFGTLAITQSIAHGWILRSQGEKFGDAWLQLVRDGDLQRAHQLHQSAGDRQLPSSPVDRYYATNDAAREELETFYADSPLKEITELPASAKLQLTQSRATRYEGVEHVELHYDVRCDDSKVTLKQFVLVVERANTDAGGVWRAVLVSEPKDE